MPPTDDMLGVALRALGFKPRDVAALVERAEGETLEARVRHALALARAVGDATKLAVRTPYPRRCLSARDRASFEAWCARWVAEHPEVPVLANVG